VPEPHLGLNRSSGLVDVLDRILEKGLVVAGDVKISLAEVELLTIRIRLIICSIDKAQAIGLDWWKGDRYFSAQGQDGRPALPAAAARVAAPPMARSPRRRATRNPERRGRTSANGPSRRRGGE
jgi:hypothetical protein